MNHDPLFFPAVALLGRDQAAGTAVGEVGLHLFVDVGDDRLRELLLVPFQRQHEVGTARDDIQGDGRLSPHRDDRSPDISQLQQRGNGCDFIRFLVGRERRANAAKSSCFSQ